MQPNCWMACIDFKNVFYAIPVHKDHQKYLENILALEPSTCMNAKWPFTNYPQYKKS